MTISNPVPSAPSNISVVGGLFAIDIEYDKPTDNDWIGTIIALSSTNPPNTTTERVAKAPGNKFSIALDSNGAALLSDTDYYVKIASYDEFGETGITFSDVYTVRLTQLPTGYYNTTGSFTVSGATVTIPEITSASLATKAKGAYTTDSWASDTVTGLIQTALDMDSANAWDSEDGTDYSTAANRASSTFYMHFVGNDRHVPYSVTVPLERTSGGRWNILGVIGPINGVEGQTYTQYKSALESAWTGTTVDSMWKLDDSDDLQGFYSTGTVSVTNGSAVITGVSTGWLGEDFGPGYSFSIDDGVTEYEILSVDSDTQITLTANYNEATDSGKSYIIYGIGFIEITSSSDPIDVGKGLWVKLSGTNATQNVVLAGYLPPVEWEVFTKWSLIGMPHGLPYVDYGSDNYTNQIDDFEATLPFDIDSIWWWDGDAGSWKSWVKGVPEFLNTLDTIEAGYAYYFGCHGNFDNEQKYVINHPELRHVFSPNETTLQTRLTNSSFAGSNISISGTTATVTSTGHGAMTEDKVELTGFTAPTGLKDTEFNNFHSITRVDDDTYTFTVSSGGSGSASGTGTIKHSHSDSVRVAKITTDASGDIETITTYRSGI